MVRIASGWERVSSDWRALPLASRAPPRTTPPATIFGVLLGPRNTSHVGASLGLNLMRRRTIHLLVEQFLRAKAAADGVANGTLEVHVMHEAPGNDYQNYNRVHLHRLTGKLRTANGVAIDPHDSRWEALLELISRIRRPANMSCAFSIDFIDVRLLRDPRELCASPESVQPAQPPLFVSTDVVGPCVRNVSHMFLRTQARATGYVVSPRLDAFLATTSYQDGRCEAEANASGWARQRVARQCNVLTTTFNCGVWGAPFGTFLSALHWLAAATTRTYAAMQSPACCLDMLLVNELALRHEGEVVRGWPYGPFSMPMQAQLCGAESFFCASAKQVRAANRSGVPCSPRTMLAAMQPRYFFGHKVGCGRTIPC